jgi:hypothetical protein
MSRILLQYLLPLILPTLIWLVWYFAVGRTRPTADGAASKLQHGPWFWLIIAGLGLLGASLIYTALTQGFDPTGTYVPPHWEGERVVPGRVQ